MVGTNTILIGITGGIGGGKSTFSACLRQRGFQVYDCDIRARFIQNNNIRVKKELVNRFGNPVFINDQLNVPYLSEIVFKNRQALSGLNQIVHPAVVADLRDWVAEHSGQRLLFAECAVLFESIFRSEVDKTVVVTASEEVRIARVMHRNHLSESQIRERMANQLPEPEKIKLADFVIDTDDQSVSMETRVQSFLNGLKDSLDG